MIKNLYYIGFYNGSKSIYRKDCEANLPGSMKMDFIIKSLKAIGKNVKVISFTVPNVSGFYPMEINKIDDLETFYYMPSIQFSLFNKKIFSFRFPILYFLLWGLRFLNRDDTIIVYHSPALCAVLKFLKSVKKFQLIIQVEELYSVANKEGQNIKEREINYLNIADGYLFVNDILPAKYFYGKPFVVSYGNYTIFDIKNTAAFNNGKIGIVYTGIINEARGVFKIIEAMNLLPDKYELHILGFGSNKNMKKMFDLIKQINEKSKFEKVKFYGTRSGKAYTNFLKPFQIGVSIMDMDTDISATAFPSKIMAYLGHSLIVVTTKNECIIKSRVRDMLYFCDDDIASIASTIMNIDLSKANNNVEKLKLLEKEFQSGLQKIFEKI